MHLAKFKPETCLFAGRLDSDYFAPRVAQLLRKLGEAGLTIGTVAPARHERFSPVKEGEFDYLEIGNLRSDGTAGAERLPQGEAPSRATQLVRAGDVLTSRAPSGGFPLSSPRSRTASYAPLVSWCCNPATYQPKCC